MSRGPTEANFHFGAAIIHKRAGSYLRVVGIFVITLLKAEISLGIAAILTGLVIGIAGAHNWLAALLLLGLVSLLAESQAGFG